jgi:16S rRNA (guanine(966)-N(2))-methyltransferase RsmD
MAVQERLHVRVIAGEARGMRLSAPRGTTTRPTTDRVKEALFSLLDSARRLDGARVLDLFAGSGALGIEALSRGAEHVVFIEKNRQALISLQQNLLHTRFSDRAEIHPFDCLQALERLARHTTQFDLVLLDPPYQAGLHQKAIELVGATLLAADGLLVAETAARMPLPERIGPCIRTDRRIYGDTALELYTMELQSHAP